MQRRLVLEKEIPRLDWKVSESKWAHLNGGKFDFLSIAGLIGSGSNCSSSVTCTAAGGSAENPLDTTPPLCSQELILNDSTLLYPLEGNTYYYFPLMSIVFVTSVNSLGFPVTCLDSAVPADLRSILRIAIAFNSLALVVAVSSIVALAVMVALYYTVKSIRGVSSVTTANFMTSSLLNDFAFLLGYPAVFFSGNQPLCLAAGVVDHFSALAQLVWIDIVIVDTGIRYHKMSKSHLPFSAVKMLACYVSLGYGVPAVLTLLEVIIAGATGTLDGQGSCFRISSLLSAIFLYIIPSFAAIGVGVVVPIVLLVHLKVDSFSFIKKDKIRFTLYFVLLSIMIVSVIVRVVGAIPLANAVTKDSLVGFFRLFVVVVRTAYLVVAFVLTSQIFSKNKVGSVLPTNSEIQLGEIQQRERPHEFPVRPDDDALFQKEAGHEELADSLADKLENPALIQQ